MVTVSSGNTKRHRCTNSFIFCALPLSTIDILATETNDDPTRFFLASGFFVAHFTTSFMLMSPRTASFKAKRGGKRLYAGQ